MTYSRKATQKENDLTPQPRAERGGRKKKREIWVGRGSEKVFIEMEIKRLQGRKRQVGMGSD
jgi:hypothetical protein